MKINIRKGTEKDFTQILVLIKELSVFEKAPDKVTNSVEQMKEEQDFFECFIAETKDGEVVGVAFYFLAYYTWVGKSLYLDDLYIKESFRRNGIGSKLLEKIFEVAKKENCKRVRWQVLHWNKPAVELYKKLGAEIDSEFHNCDFDYKGIQQFKI